MRKLLLLFSFLLVSSALWAYDNEDQMMKIEPGMKKEDVLQVIGQPDSIMSKAVNEQGERVEVYKYIFTKPVEEIAPVKEPFIKPEFSRDAKSTMTQDAATEPKMISHPSFLIDFVNEVVQSVEKS